MGHITDTPTPESVWAYMQESARRFDREMAESRARSDAEWQRRDAEWQRRDAEWQRRDAEWQRKQEAEEARHQIIDAELRRLDESAEKTLRAVRELKVESDKTFRAIRELNGAFGKAIERITTPDLHNKFAALGYDFAPVVRNKKFRNENKESVAEVDAYYENHEYVMAVEVKNNMQFLDVKVHLSRMNILRQIANQRGDQRKYLGAIAAPDIADWVKQTAYDAGFYVIKVSDKAVNIVVPKGFKPKEY